MIESKGNEYMATASNVGESNPTGSTPKTPSMIASLVVVGTMIALIIFSAIMFGSELADGPLQVT